MTAGNDATELLEPFGMMQGHGLTSSRAGAQRTPRVPPAKVWPAAHDRLGPGRGARAVRREWAQPATCVRPMHPRGTTGVVMLARQRVTDCPTRTQRGPDARQR
jgi:hypothetical protein